MKTEPTNAHEYSVSELAFSLKRTVEETFGRVRVRGELGRVTIAKSGHMYADLKDDKAIIASVMWKGSVARLSVRPEEGMEVVATGRLSTYPGRSQYQLIMETLEPAGVGALMALLEKRRKMFEAEGVFAPEHKQDLPWMPDVIGVVTSPTGAVIRDILHRLSDRFPVHVLLWPVLVQGEKAAAQITEAIAGFNHLPEDGDIPRPDVIIVARGGGSIEDLWCFNEENVVRAAFASDIPLISAVGHETDWTLIDYVADERAPTPTGAAEIAVPVRTELAELLEDYGLRLKRALSRQVERSAMRLKSARLPRLETILAGPQQGFDLATARLLPALMAGIKAHETRLHLLSTRLRPDVLKRELEQKQDRLTRLSREMARAMSLQQKQKADSLARASALLDAYSYQGVLQRGYALVTDMHGHIVRKGKSLKSGQHVWLRFADVKRKAVIDGTNTQKHKSRKAKKTDENQGRLF